MEVLSEYGLKEMAKAVELALNEPMKLKRVGLLGAAHTSGRWSGSAWLR